MKMMKAVSLNEHGSAEVLKLIDSPLPNVKPGTVLLRHQAIAVNFKDIYERSGLYPLQLPSGLGFEAVGIVEEVGAEVDHISVGDRVAYCYGPLGAYAEASVVPADIVVPVPDFLSSAEAAAVLAKGLTAEYLLFQTYKVQPGDWIVVYAAAGGVGSLVVQWALSLNARVIAAVGSDEKVSYVKSFGCEHVVNYRSDDLVKFVQEVTESRGVQVAYDSVGATTWETSLEVLAPRGMLVSYGNASGPVPPTTPLALAKKSLYLTRPSLRDYIGTRPELLASAQRLFQAIKQKVLSVRIDRTFALADIVAAHRYLEGRQALGSIVVYPS